MSLAALVLGLLAPLAPPAAVAEDDAPAPPAWVQQGDETTFLTVDDQRYILHHYADPDASYPDFEVPAYVREVEYLVVGGGGGGGERGGGGGAGGVLEGLAGAGLDVTGGQELTVAVGAGGEPGASGDDSTFGDVVAAGGGHGGNAANDRGGAQGGSGGGGGHWLSYETQGGEAISDQGSAGGKGGKIGQTRDGGDSEHEGWGAGGGGGATAPGEDAETDGTPGDGGSGYESSITGTSLFYGGGGGGHFLDRSVTMTAGGSGGEGGGGDGGSPCGGTPGEDGLGGGGGGGDTRTTPDGDFTVTADTPTCTTDNLDTALPQRGGSGVVLVRYLADNLVTVTDVTAGAATVTAGQSTSITVTVEDIEGEAASDTEVRLTASPGGDPGPVSTDADGQATFTVSSDTAGSVTYTATIDGVEMGDSVEVEYTEPPAWEAPDPGDQGAFRISSYAGSGISEAPSHWWRGYVFTVAEGTTVTHLVGSGMQWSTVGLFEAEETDGRYHAAIQDQVAWGEASTNAEQLHALALGWVLFEGDVTDEPKALDAPVTLLPDTQYLLVQSAAQENGSFTTGDHNRSVDRIDRDDLLSHPRIGEVWIPEDDHSLRWNGSDAVTIAGTKDSPSVDSDPLMPLIGFLYDTEATGATVTTTDPAETAFGGTLSDTGGSASTLCVDVGETEAGYERHCLDTVAAEATDGSAVVTFALDPGDLSGFDSGTLSYRAVAINEVGVALGGWESTYHTAGTLITSQAFTTSMPDPDAGWVFASQPPSGAWDRDYPSIRDGHLRLVPAENTWSGSAIYDRAQPTSAGLDVSFRTRQFGGSGADGLSFFLADGVTTDIVPGDSGGRLGYVNLGGDGGAGALLGIGLDTFGNFAHEQTSGCKPTYGQTRNALTIRGGPADDWCVLNPPVHVTDGWGPERLVRIQVDPSDSTDPQVRVLLDGVQVASFDQPTALREVGFFKFGFTASTGGSNNNHDIWDVEVRSLTALPEIAWVTDSLPAASFDQPYDSGELLVDHAVNPITIEVTDGSLPTGLQVTDGTISGTPTEAGTFTFTLQVTDSREHASTATQAFTLKVSTAAPTVQTTSASVAGDAPTTSIEVTGDVTDAGSSPVSERGFVLAEADSGDPTYDDHAVRLAAGSGSDAFSATIAELTPNTAYVVRAYAINGAGTAYGDTLELTTRQPLTLASFEVEDRSYDGTTTAVVTSYELDGVLAAHPDVQLEGVDAGYLDAAVGEHTVTITAAHLGGTDAGSYALDLSDVPSSSASITPRTVTVGGELVAAGKVYNRSRAATVDADALSLVGAVVGDDLSLAPVAAFSSSRAGRHTVSLTPASVLTGTSAANYVLELEGAPTASASIARRRVTVSGASATSRPYDGTTTATVRGASLSGVLSGDTVSLSGQDTARFDRADAGQRSVAVDWSLTGSAAANYRLASAAALSATIHPAEATLSFAGGLSWTAFGPDEQAATAPVVEVATATGEDLRDAVTIRYGPDDALTTSQPREPGSYRVTASLAHPNYTAQPRRATAVVLAPTDANEDGEPDGDGDGDHTEEGAEPQIGPVSDQDEDGEPVAPQRAPSDATVRDGDTEVAATVHSDRPGAPLTVETDDGFSLSLSARDGSSSAPRGVDAEGRLTITGGRWLRAEGEGFAAGSRAEVWVFSEARFLGTVEVDADGRFTGELAVPADLTPGEHTIQLNGYRSDGTVRSTSLGVVVEAADTDADPVPAPHPVVCTEVEGALQGFGDVTAGSSHAEAVCLTVWAGIALGYPDATFRPEDPISRGEFASLLTRALELPAEGPTPFHDADEAGAHTGSIAALAAADIAIGYRDGTFRPNDPITRAELASVLARALDLTAEGAPPFRDVDPGDTHADAIAAITAAGIAIGDTNGDFRPRQPINRGQTAQLLARALDLQAAFEEAAAAGIAAHARQDR